MLSRFNVCHCGNTHSSCGSKGGSGLFETGTVTAGQTRHSWVLPNSGAALFLGEPGFQILGKNPSRRFYHDHCNAGGDNLPETGN